MDLQRLLFPARTRRQRRAASARARRQAVKATRAHEAILVGGGRAVWTPREYEKLAEEGYETADVVYRCVRYIVDGFLTLPIRLYDGAPGTSEAEVITDHPSLQLLKRPNEYDSEAEFREQWMSYLLIAGNSYVHGPTPGPLSQRSGEPQFLHCLRPDKMKVLKSKDWRDPIAGYEYSERKGVELPKEEVGHTKLFHPRNFFYGLGPIEPAARAVDQYNAAGTWNTATLQNSAVPRSVVNLRGAVSQGAADAFKQGFQEYVAGANAGRSTLFVRAVDGIDFKQLAMTALELDWLGGMNEAARAICRAYGVPPQVVGITGDATYANFEQAEKSGWTSARLPMAMRYCDFLTQWLLPKYATEEEDLFFNYDASGVEALQADKKEQRQAAAVLFEQGVITQKQAAAMAGEDDSEAAAAYVWELDPRRMAPTRQEAARRMEQARQQFGPRVLAALNGQVSVN